MRRRDLGPSFQLERKKGKALAASVFFAIVFFCLALWLAAGAINAIGY